MSLVSNLLDLGNILFFVSSLKQMHTAYKNRDNLQGLSSKMLIGYIMSTVCFISAGILLSALATIILGILNILFFSLQLYWKRKYRIPLCLIDCPSCGSYDTRLMNDGVTRICFDCTFVYDGEKHG